MIRMPKGQNTNSGPPPDPNSLNSAKRGLTFTALPANGYDGEVPDYPLPKVKVYEIYFEDKQRVKDYDAETTEDRFARELELWAWAWRTPQAAAWAKEPWRQHPVALWVRTAAICEGADATAADKNSLHRFADQIGLTPAGLAFNGWKIAADQLAEKRAEKAPAPAVPTARDRMKALRGAAGQ
jgi:hypothetical protein